MTFTLIAVFGVFQIILFLMHLAIYQSLAAAFGLSLPWLEWLFLLLSFTFVSASILAHRFCNPFVKWYYRASAYWFGLIQFLFIASVVFCFSSAAFYDTDHYISPAILGAVSFGFFFLLHCYATWQTNRIKVTRLDVVLPHAEGAWHSFWQGKKIVFVSDVHLGAVRSEGFAKKVVAAIAAQSPNVVLIGGDMFDGVKCHSKSLVDPFSALRPLQGIYFASGNHEYIEDVVTLHKHIESVGIRLLNNQVIDIHGLQIAGVDWKDTHKKENFERILADMHIDKTKPSILMRHEPNHLEIAERGGISLTLSGHTHGGAQIWPLRIITYRMYKGFDYGFKKLRDMMVYTSSGVGTWGPPLRFGTKSEIVVLTLK